MAKLAMMINAAVVAAAVFGGGPGAASATDAPPGNVAEGKRLYLADGCFLCHGRSGQGGALNGPAPILAQTAMPFEGFKEQLRRPANDMATYSESVMSDQQVADIYAYVQSLPGPRPAKDIPMLND
jgi:mono/diheme cytochrome c family protein